MMSRRGKCLVGGSAIAAFLLVTVIGITPTTLMPSIFAQNDSHSSVTGYFGLDEGGMPIVDRHGVMLVFDGAIETETVLVDTFEVSLNGGSFAKVVATRVEEEFVFLRLRDELASDASPTVGIAEGKEIEDLAGNSTNRRKLGFVQVKDGIAPRLTVTLSGGSGLGTGDEGADRLTKDTIDVRITSDEPLQGAPRVVVVCESLNWTEIVDERDVERDIDDFIANRNGAFPNSPEEPADTNYTCGYDADNDGMDDVFELTEDVANSRPDEVWEYSWRNPAGSTTGLRDGQLMVVAYGRDRSRYERFGTMVSNWATAEAGFRIDAQFGSNDLPDGVTVQPKDGSKVSEERPFITIEFPETSTITLNSVLFDGLEIKSRFNNVGDNQFIYWPPCLNTGNHLVEVSASDSAGNTIGFDFGFETTQRCDFQIELLSGWNLVSLPSDPLDTSIDAVFTDPSIMRVLTLDPLVTTAPWSIAVRREDDGWETPNEGRPLTEINQNLGYWVISSASVRQPVALRERGTRPVFEWLSDVVGGWHLVGVVDDSGNQTQDSYGELLKDQDGNPVLAGEYLGEHVNAYTWDAQIGNFVVLQPDETLTIGEGIWVLYDSVAGSIASSSNELPSDTGPRADDTGPRADFELDLRVGWNSVSLPSDPLDPSINGVFTEPSIQTVISWNPSDSAVPWSVAVRRGDIWESPKVFHSLNEIRQNKGYWVESAEVVTQPIVLRKYASLPEDERLVALHNYGLPPEADRSLIVTEGWHFVGVVDYAGNQTQDNYGEVLENQSGAAVSAQEYVGGYTHAFTWDPIEVQFESLAPDDPMTIGDGIWVYYAPADR